jgi:hypothetical protein
MDKTGMKSPIADFPVCVVDTVDRQMKLADEEGQPSVGLGNSSKQNSPMFVFISGKEMTVQGIEVVLSNSDATFLLH